MYDNSVTERKERYDEIRPLHEFPKRTTAESPLREIDARFLAEKAHVHNDLNVAALAEPTRNSLHLTDDVELFPENVQGDHSLQSSTWEEGVQCDFV